MHKLVLFLVLLSWGNLFSQQIDTVPALKEIKYDRVANRQPVLFNTREIDSLKHAEEFNYIDTKEQDSWWVRFKRWVSAKFRQFMEWLFGDYKANAVLQFFIKILPYLLLGILLGLIIWLFARLNPAGRALEAPRQSKVLLNEEEELVKNKDISGLIEQAIKNGDFRLAVRYYYLRELQNLDKKGAIAYEFQKTNQDYLEELNKDALKSQFSVITMIYEFIWYGSFEVSEKDFRLAQQGFSKMDQELKALSNG